MEFREIYCNNCKKMLGRYNIKYYDSDKIKEILKSRHSLHIRKGHQVIIRNFIKET
jgi:hypothetical protein